MPRNEYLRQRRIQRNWRQQDIADQLGVTIVTVQRWERGVQQPTAYYRIKLCALFGLSAEELGLAEPALLKAENTPLETELPFLSPTEEEIELWTVPYARNPHFTGRAELLSALEQQLSPQEPDQPTRIRQTALTQTQAIKGLGGIGKTQVAVEYAYRAREQARYAHTLWITAASEEAIQSSFLELAALLPAISTKGETDQHRLVAAIIAWLEQCEQPWLMIFDNADEPSLVLPYLPRRGKGSILLTTRASAVGSLAPSIEVETMGLLEGTHLLLRRAHRFTHATDEEINEAGNIVVELGQFPLALDQAGAYIEETGCSLHDYLQIYQQHRHVLLARRGRQATGYPEPVATTWSLSFEQVEQVNPAATELLRLCAFLAPDHIPEELLIKGAPHWPPLLRQAVMDSFTFNQLLEPLLAFSLVKRLSEDHLLSIHRLVQAVQMERLSPEEQQQWAERLVRAVNVIFPRDPQDPVAAWPRCQRYLEQGQACDTLIQQHQLLLPEAAEVLERAATYLRERAMYARAEPLYQRALHIQEHLLEAEHPLIASLLNDLAVLYYQQGRYAEAEPLYEQALHIREQRLEPEHPDTAQSLNDLGLLYYNQGKYAEAEQLYQRALHIRERRLEPDHPLMAESLHNLALLYSEQGRYAEAEPFYLRDLHILEKQQGAEHSEVAYPLTGLAFLYYKQGKYEQAEPLYQRALRIWEQTLGLEHPHVAYILHGLANLYHQQGKYEQAGPLYQKALHIREQQLGAEHVETANVLHDFADFQRDLGHTSEAIAFYQRALATREQVLGVDHPTTSETREHLQALQVVRG
jgi:tetratricopeptide (TPR) repeat protein/transcriptional regulator with XRE-family HTH domain